MNTPLKSGTGCGPSFVVIVRAALLSTFALTASCGSAEEGAPSPRADPRLASSWEIGPVIDGRNYSEGVPLHPRARASGTWEIDLPRGPGSVHYVTFQHGSLVGRQRLTMRYRVEAGQGARIVPATAPQLPSIITLYFQRRGDTWSGRGPYEAYRWYATFASQSPITPGEHVMIAPLNGNWTAVETSSARMNPEAFRAALAGADRVGFVLGGGTGYGHGVFATGPVRLVITDFRVE